MTARHMLWGSFTLTCAWEHEDEEIGADTDRKKENNAHASLFDLLLPNDD